jgi:hypothetical protein
MRVLRIICDVVLVIAAFTAPWWVAIFLGIILLFVFNTYYELIVFGFIIDTLYNAPVARFYHFQFMLTCAAIIFVFISIQVKARLRWYDQN